MNISDGMTYAPKGKPSPVVKSGEFVFSAVRLDHGHIYGMCNGLTEAGGTIKYVYDKDPRKVDAFLKAFPTAKAAKCEEEALEDPDTHMIAGAAVTSERCALGLRAMEAGKDYFTDKNDIYSYYDENEINPHLRRELSYSDITIHMKKEETFDLKPLLKKENITKNMNQ